MGGIVQTDTVANLYAEMVDYQVATQTMQSNSQSMYLVNTNAHYIESASSNLDGIFGRAFNPSKKVSSVGHKYVIIQNSANPTDAARYSLYQEILLNYIFKIHEYWQDNSRLLIIRPSSQYLIASDPPLNFVDHSETPFNQAFAATFPDYTVAIPNLNASVLHGNAIIIDMTTMLPTPTCASCSGFPYIQTVFLSTSKTDLSTTPANRIPMIASLIPFPNPNNRR